MRGCAGGRARDLAVRHLRRRAVRGRRARPAPPHGSRAAGRAPRTPRSAARTCSYSSRLAAGLARPGARARRRARCSSARSTAWSDTCSACSRAPGALRSRSRHGGRWARRGAPGSIRAALRARRRPASTSSSATPSTRRWSPSRSVALLVPTPATALGLVLCVIGVQVQTRQVEEPHLLALHGERYEDYAGARRALLARDRPARRARTREVGEPRLRCAAASARSPSSGGS